MVQRDRTWSNMVQRGGEGEAFAYPASSAMMYCSDRKWSNVVQSDPWWSNMAESVTGWSKMVQRCRRWSNVVEHGLTLSNMVQLGPTSERSGFLSNKSTHTRAAGRHICTPVQKPFPIASTASGQRCKHVHDDACENKRGRTFCNALQTPAQ